MQYEETIQQAVVDKKLLATAGQNIIKWLGEDKYQQYQAELQKLIDSEQWQVLNDSFFKVLPFGTGGRRGTVGLGPNRINNVTIGESAQGLATYLQEQNSAQTLASVVIAHDTRTTSRALAELTAAIFAANDFQVYLFDTFRATPELSFAVRYFEAAAGVVISASHNPPADNGFKVYWHDGGQVVAPYDAGIMAAVEAVADITTMDYQEAVASELIAIVSDEVDKAYIEAIVNESVTPSRSASIVYSPLHGCGSRSALLALQAAGFENILTVEEQMSPDGAFPNIKNNIPNPEVRDSSALAVALAEKNQADIAVTTDPDVDRLGVVARTADGTYQFLNGNQIAALLGHFVITQLHEQEQLKPEHFLVKTIVTTDLLTAIAKEFNLKVYDDILIGFKFVADLIRQKEDLGTELFLFGGEESHGILKGSYTRDKDAAVAALLMAELTSYLKDQGKTLIDQLYELYRHYGIYTETLVNIQYPGAAGSQTMARLMAGLRAKPPTEINNKPVIKVIDRQTYDDPKLRGDVLIFQLSDDGQTRLTVRPSGTEPKLKIYTQLHMSADDTDMASQLAAADTKAQALSQTLQDYFAKIL